jgi:hypothetical protein
MYYSSVFLDMHPTPLDMSLLDTDEIICDTSKYTSSILFTQESAVSVINPVEKRMIVNKDLSDLSTKNKWLNIKANLTSDQGYQNGSLNCLLKSKDKTKHEKIRLANAITWQGIPCEYEFFVEFPEWDVDALFLFVESEDGYTGTFNNTKLTLLQKK